MGSNAYAFPLGVIKSLEARLIPGHKIRRLAETRDADDFLRSLADTSYAGGRGIFDAAHDAPASGSSARSDEAGFALSEYIVEEKPREVFTAEHNLPGALAAIKSALRGDEDVSAPAAPARRRPAAGITASYFAEIESSVSRRRFFGLKAPLGDICRVVASGEHPSPAAADFAAYSVFFSWALAETDGFPAARDYFRSRIDAHNAATFESSRARDVSWRPAFFTGGFVDASVFADAFASGTEPQALFSTPRFYAYRNIFVSAVPRAVYASKYADDAATAHWTRMRLEPFGFHQVCGYAHAKKTEIKNLKIILSGIRAGLSADEIKRHLRNSYF